jgi:hypothetical protein
VLLRLAYLGLTNTFAMLRLIPMSNQDKDIEILALRHQIAVLQRQLGDTRVRFSPADRALLTALLHRLPRPALTQTPSAGAAGPSCADTVRTDPRSHSPRFATSLLATTSRGRQFANQTPASARISRFHRPAARGRRPRHTSWRGLRHDRTTTEVIAPRATSRPAPPPEPVAPQPQRITVQVGLRKYECFDDN